MLGKRGRLMPALIATLSIGLHATLLGSVAPARASTTPTVSEASEATNIEILVYPEDTERLVSLIASARQTLDIVIYEIGGPLVVGQPGAPGALMEAVARGVKVRVLLNGNWPGKGQPCVAGVNQTRQTQRGCAVSQMSWAYAVRAALTWAYQHPKPGVQPVRPEVQAANNNFQTTHQKTILIDGTYRAGPMAGEPRPSHDLLPTSRAVISTGNLLAYGWGDTRKSIDWMLDPASTCDGTCPLETQARDFAAVVSDPVLVPEIARIFRSDYLCGAPSDTDLPSRRNTNALRTTDLPLTWSNGTLQMPPSSRAFAYPTLTRGYEIPSRGAPQGNVRERTLALIQSAQRSLRVYNEELQDPQIVGALIDASRRLGPGSVRILMTYTPVRDSPQETFAPSFQQLAQAGASIMLSEYAGPGITNLGQLYIHAKVFIADGTDAYVGSTNAATASMDFNRELGIMLTSRPDRATLPSHAFAPKALRTLVTTFDRDFGDTAMVTPWSIIGPATQAGDASNAPGPGIPPWPQTPWPGTVPIACGPLP